MERTQRIRTLCTLLADGLYEREEAVRLSLLALLSGESIFLLGPPGVAKSLIARRLKFAFEDGKAFEYLMNRFSTPDELFGPVSIKKLKEEDKYERITEHYLPGANIVFLDEIWKAGPSIQNALLTILNERIFRNGEQEVDVNIRGIIAASNELPLAGEGLEALWDRFLLRLEVREIQDASQFTAMLQDSRNDLEQDPVAVQHKIKAEELELWDKEIQQISLPQEVLDALQMIKLKLERGKEGNGQGLKIYDRRWKKTVRLLRTAAFMEGRTAVDLMDVYLLNHCLWESPQDRNWVAEAVTTSVRDHGYSLGFDLNLIARELDAWEQEVDQEIRIRKPVLKEAPRVIDHRYYQALELEKIYGAERIKRQDFEQLEATNWLAISLFSNEEEVVSKIRARKAEDEFSIEIQHQAREVTIRLDTEKRESEDIFYKKPHPLVQNYWQEKADKLKEHLKTQLEQLLAKEKAIDNANADPLFTPKTFQKFVVHNLKSTQERIKDLEHRLELIKHSYERLEL